MLENSIILKIGGSVLTYKNKNSVLNFQTIENTAVEIKKLLSDNIGKNLIFISGAGSYGHPLAYKYMINEESRNNKTDIGFLRTTTNMQKMGNKIAEIFHKYDVPLFPLPPSSIFTTNKGRIICCNIDIILKSLNNYQIPFMWGDAVFDKSHKYRILSGDQIVSYLYAELNFNKLFFGTNVDGIFTDNPFTDKNAKIISDINNENYDEILHLLSFSNCVDVTKGMRGKLEEIYSIKKRPLECVIYNALIKNNTYNAIREGKIGTKIYLER